jgi:hypothetical protein
MSSVELHYDCTAFFRGHLPGQKYFAERVGDEQWRVDWITHFPSHAHKVFHIEYQ